MKLGTCVDIVTALVAAALLVGCASAPTQEEISRADYGQPMSQQECLSISEAAIANQLKDPSSAQFRNEPPCYTGWVSSVPLMGLRAAFGYVQRGEVNGKNSFGGYVGFRPYLVLIKNGVVVRSCITDPNGVCIPSGQ
ncbi:hypothetical protein ACFONG_16005 [Uliginosibacterium paludis]|uniref:Lipoprotein n=1 Tax=Uliginosibacterium paludis TaxID=1615952 RepID=A0ABV2CV05_9RHOO